MIPTIDAHGIRKRFGRVEALAGLDLTVEPGQVVALLGPNGAGNTTFVRIVATLLRPDKGTLGVYGSDALRQPECVRRLIVLAGQPPADECVNTGRHNLDMVASLYSHARRNVKVL